MFKLCLYAKIILVCVGMEAHMKNVALNKSCGSSSRHNDIEDCSGAINGNYKTFYDHMRPWINCIHTNFNDFKPFWWVDLGQEFTLNTITIFGRRSLINRMKCVNVSVDGKVIKRFDDVSGWTKGKYDIRANIKGRVINITKDCDSEGTMLNICEVQVWGDCLGSCNAVFQPSSCIKLCTTGVYGAGCKETCNCTENICNDGWYGNCSMSCGHCAGGSVCDKLDGKCGNCERGFQPPHCKDYLLGHNNVSNDCHNTCGEGTCQCRPGWELPLCGGCSTGHYNMSNDCQNTCGEGCHDTCSRTDGTCQCRTGWQPPLCQGCGDGWFGSECTECGHCANNSVCDKKTGVCPFCDGDFVAPLCLHAREAVSLVGPVVGAAVTCSVVFLAIGVVIGLYVLDDNTFSKASRYHKSRQHFHRLQKR